ncbi:MAG: 16S rRNA (guanine(527)-N(7))-methyltransferase RsmG [Candidatus Latescibacter sp.]|nr:16S rRNA (guanine(527)-N(7))-methyltransferase RsmG [Candidatus Latescibacter sp.]
MPVPNDFFLTLTGGAAAYGIHLEDDALSLFAQYTDLLLLWNRNMNLVSRRDMSRFVEYHLLDSLKVSSCVDLLSVETLMDFGSGAGLPGIPLTIAFPHLKTVLVDSIAKKVHFLSQVVATLPLPSVSVMRSRVEELPSSHNGSFDMVITRATVSLCQFFLFTARFIRPEGMMVSIKGEHIEHELDDLSNYLDSRLFNISINKPPAVNHVRTGYVVIITKLKVIHKT